MEDMQRCVACHSNPLLPFGRRLNYLYALCPSCETIQLAPLPSQSDLTQQYREEYATAEHYQKDPSACWDSARTYYQAIVQALKDHGAKGSILDYGSGWGGLIEMLLANGFQASGCELAQDMVRYCKSRGLSVQNGDITAVLRGGAIRCDGSVHGV